MHSLVVVVLALSLSIVSALVTTFNVNCVPLTIQRSDPIVFPGIPSAHVHAIVGGNAFQRSMPNTNSAVLATATTCNKALDHSNYWIPQLYHYANGQYTMVTFQGTAHYYQLRACNYAAGLTQCNPNVIPTAFPTGFRMVAGNPARRSQNATSFADKAIDMMCLYQDGSYEAPGFPTRPCLRLRAQVYFPSCWDGKNIDSPDHSSHVAYPAIGDYNGGVCPQSHPVALFSLFYEFFFDTSPFMSDITHFAFANADPTGYGLHGDFIMGWTDRDALQNAFNTCIDEENCPTLGVQSANPQTLIYPAPTENVGLNGPISALPGNNTINWNTVRMDKPFASKHSMKMN